MSQVPGTTEFRCDRDGKDLGNGGVDKCIVVSDLDPDRPGMVRNLHFCRETCAEILLSPENLEWYEKQKEERDAEDSAELSGEHGIDDGGSERAEERSD